jgi:hypothetical protein
MPDVWEALPKNLDGKGVAKDQCAKGSARGHAYPHGELMPGVPVLITEGESDALTAFQEVGHVVNVVSVGGTGQTPASETLAVLANCPRWLLAFDRDNAGRDAVKRWYERYPDKAVLASVPAADINKFHQDGGSLLDWLHGEFNRLGWHWPLRA